MIFKTKWQAAVEKKNSVLCAGLDPADLASGAKDALAQGIDKRMWALGYVHAIAPYCAAIKPNKRFWEAAGDDAALSQISDLAHSHGMVVIDDSKLADIGSTNAHGFYNSWGRNVDAVTVAPYAGNIAEAAAQAHGLSLGIITMCIMSNPEYEREKNKLVPIGDPASYRHDVVNVQGTSYVPQYLWLAAMAHESNIDGIVLGAPSSKNHITETELAKARHYAGDNVLALVPGVGAQGGEAGALFKYFGKDGAIINVGRDLMFPKGKTHAEAARDYRDMLNTLRGA